MLQNIDVTRLTVQHPDVREGDCMDGMDALDAVGSLFAVPISVSHWMTDLTGWLS